MEPGDLRNRVKIQQRIDTRDPIGGTISTWRSLAIVWAAVQPMSGRELISAQQKHAEATTRFRIRYRKDLEPPIRLVWEGKAYDILEIVDVNGAHWEMDLLTSSGLRSG